MRRLVMLAGTAAAVAGAAIALGPTTAAGATEPLCRRAPQLAKLPAEAAAQQQQDYVSGGAVDTPSPVVTVGTPPPPAPPPPPPPPSAPRPMSAERDGSDSATVVSGTRARESAKSA